MPENLRESIIQLKAMLQPNLSSVMKLDEEQRQAIQTAIYKLELLEKVGEVMPIQDKITNIILKVAMAHHKLLKSKPSTSVNIF